MRKEIVIRKLSIKTGEVIEEFPSFKIASIKNSMPVAKIRKATSYKAGRAGGYIWQKRWANPIIRHLADTKDMELAVFATCAQCSGMDESDPFMPDDVRDDIKHCPCKCYLLPFRPFRNKDY